MNSIYIIKNNQTEDFYIGRTKNFKKRIERHFSDLKRGTHHSIFLQRAYNKYGKSSFEFEILYDNLCLEDAKILEEEMIKEASYNVSSSSSGGDLISNHPEREKILEKIRASVIKRYSLMTDQEKKIKHGKPGELNPMFNKKHSAETRNKISKNRSIPWNRGKKILFSDEHKKNISLSLKGSKPWNLGKKTGALSKEHREKISNANKGKPSNHRKKVSCEGIVFNSVEEAARYYNITSAGMVVRLKSKTENMKDFFYLEENAERLSKPHKNVRE